MKRFLVLLILSVFTAGVLVTSEEAVLIDFSQLVADTKVGENVDSQNGRTLVDYSGVAGASFTKDEKKFMKTSLAIGEWEVKLASSSRTVKNQSRSMTSEAVVKQDAELFGGQLVMGVRIHFPEDRFNSYAIIKPPFEIPAYEDITTLNQDGTLTASKDPAAKYAKFDGFGVVKNVGVLKSVSVWVRGLNFPHTLSIILRDERNIDHQIFIDSLEFDGWRQLTWNNPNYITEVRNREVRKFSLYPKSAPLVKLAGFIISRDAAMEGGDFVTYIKDVKVTYDKALSTLERDIDDEAVWGILDEKESHRRKVELDRLGKIQVLRYLEKAKMHQDKEASSQ